MSMMLVLVFRKDRTARVSAEAILAQGWSFFFRSEPRVI
jgi:hypothetical protein